MRLQLLRVKVFEILRLHFNTDDTTRILTINLNVLRSYFLSHGQLGAPDSNVPLFPKLNFAAVTKVDIARWKDGA